MTQFDEARRGRTFKEKEDVARWATGESPARPACMGVNLPVDGVAAEREGAGASRAGAEDSPDPLAERPIFAAERLDAIAQDNVQTRRQMLERMGMIASEHVPPGHAIIMGLDPARPPQVGDHIHATMVGGRPQMDANGNPARPEVVKKQLERERDEVRAKRDELEKRVAALEAEVRKLETTPTQLSEKTWKALQETHDYSARLDAVRPKIPPRPMPNEIEAYLEGTLNQERVWALGFEWEPMEHLINQIGDPGTRDPASRRQTHGDMNMDLLAYNVAQRVGQQVWAEGQTFTVTDINPA
jgi:hypothetical protein